MHRRAGTRPHCLDNFPMVPFAHASIGACAHLKDEVFKMLMDKMQLRVTLDGRKKPADY